MELLYTSLTIFLCPAFFFFFLHYKIVKLFMIIVQFILWVLLSYIKIYYKHHELWNEPEFQYIHKTPFLPIKNLIPNYSTNGTFSHLNYELSEGIFSINETDEYSKECLENYFIKNIEECPLTHIILENSKNYEYENYTEIKISDDKYLYFSRYNKYGQLYNYSNKLIDDLDFRENNFDYISVEKIKRKEYNKLSNPIIEYKHFIHLSNYIILALLIISFIYTFIELPIERRFNYFKIINTIIQIILFLLYLKRYLKFIKVKNFFLIIEIFIKLKKKKKMTIFLFGKEKKKNIIIFQQIYLILIVFQ